MFVAFRNCIDTLGSVILDWCIKNVSDFNLLLGHHALIWYHNLFSQVFFKSVCRAAEICNDAAH